MITSKDDYIHINADWSLSGDELCITLYKQRLTKKGKIQYDVKGYYPDYPTALKAMVDKDIQPLNNIELICDRIEQLRADIKSFAESMCDRTEGLKRNVYTQV